MSRLRCAWKAQASWLWLVLLAILAGMTLLLLGDAFRPFAKGRSARDLTVILELYLPLALAALAAAVPALERDAGVAELHLSYREPAALRLLQYLAIPLALWLLAVLSVGMAALVWYPPDPLPAAAPAAAPAATWSLPITAPAVVEMALWPALGLTGAALAGSALARHQLGGVLASALWWGTDLQMPGELNRWFYLFNVYHPVADLNPAVMHRNILLLALGGLVLALLLAERRERWVR